MTLILYFTRDYTTHDHRFLSALAETEYKVAYLRLERRGHALEDRPLPAEIEQIHWAGGERPARLLDGPGLLLDLKRVIREVKPDLILAGPLQSAALLAALAGSAPLVSMSWGYDLLIDADRSALWRQVTRYTLARSAVMVGDCATIRQKAVGFGIPDERIVTFPWGIDLQHFSPSSAPPGISPDPPQPSPSPHRPFTLLSTRGWEPVYGVEIIARAFARAAQQQESLRLMMLGNGSQAALLRKIFLEAGVQDRVSFPGQISQAGLPRYYRCVDLYVSASHSDGSSISLLEAMACGKPALVSDIPGNREWVAPGVNGWWFEDGSVDGLAQAILKAFEQRTELEKMGLAARLLAEQRADWKKNFPQLLHAFNIALRKEMQ